MADAIVIVLPIVRIERYADGDVETDDPIGGRTPAGVDLAHQELKPSSDRSNVIVLARAREERERDG
jgi:hypothetical protein